MVLNIQNETARLKTVVLGQPHSMGADPSLEETYDAKSYETVKDGVYPTEENIALEMSAFEKVLMKYDVEVLRPLILPNCNQVFAREWRLLLKTKL